MALNRTYTLEQIRTRMINLGLQNLTAAELIENFQKMEDDSEQRINDKKKACNEWYENCVGKCFLIDFNGNSYAAFRIDHSPAFSDKMEGIRICVSPGVGSGTGSRIEYDKKDAFNRFWLQNPHEDNGMYGGSGIRSVREITDKEFDKLVTTYNKVTEILKDAVK